MKTLNRSQFNAHPFHLVDPSPWPLVSSMSLLLLTMSSVLAFHGYSNAHYLVIVGLLAVVSSMIFWWRDVIAEATYKGHHTFAVQKGLTIGVLLFIVSEVFFFLSIFWAFFHSSLAPTVDIGTAWPPMGIEALNPFELPLLNTVILLSSGASVTYAHHCLIKADRKSAYVGLLVTIVLAVTFTILQGFEYWNAPFTISDGAYGSCFYLGTGFHGLHVMIGTAFLAVGLWLLRAYHLTDHHHVGFESGIVYWHFVDVVWLFLFISIYWWGS